MLIARYLKHDRIRLRMLTAPLDEDEAEALGARADRVLKERILEEIAHFLEETSEVGNGKRLLTDLIHRERKACTAVGSGLAIPHVRSMNVREPTVALLRSAEGLPFEAPDGQPVHIFLVMIAPPWDDKLYLKFYKEAAELFLREDVLNWLMNAENETEVIQFFRSPEKYTTEW